MIEDKVAPPPRRGRPRDPERLRRIMEAARSHFDAQGFERASVDAIATEAGVSKMTIYSHFASKEGLFEAVIRDRTDRVMGGLAGVEALDPEQPGKALLAIGAQFLTLAREEDALGQFRSLYGAAATQHEACLAFYRQGADRLISDLAAYLRRADAQGALHIRHPRQAADLFLSMFLGDGHIRGLLMLDMPDTRENKALLKEAVRMFMAAYAKAP
ncbi:TetR/AcrR family transcriptional regulator [Paucibacter sp. PLA-PC-4]|uniref:TetR/AcrR family transcriptional regulator n=1 Tax=Paucibacter sp. PLA-PC-4 TaxID=2993655 RepID=UPI00224B1EA8|nr:TetR/AcrR family transcriptional regulator [Paucibacter sp. PLA-PC-4]MCX2864701.1 TetR/AcrR family transcriptional regulator [Paucibacter sp. PLA-PC-4]